MENAQLAIEKRSQPGGEAPHQNLIDTIVWLKELLEERDDHMKRVISWRTQRGLECLMRSYQNAAKELEPSEKTLELASPKTINDIRTVVARNLQDDEKYVDARIKMEQLRKDIWYIRFGGYFPIGSDTRRLRGDTIKRRKIVLKEAEAEEAAEAEEEMKRRKALMEAEEAAALAEYEERRKRWKAMIVAGEAEKVEKEMEEAQETKTATDPQTSSQEADIAKRFERATWRQILKDLKEEDRLTKEYRRDIKETAFTISYRRLPSRPLTPMTDLVNSLTMLFPLTFRLAARDCMKYYLTQSGTTRSHCDSMVAAGSWNPLATRLASDFLHLYWSSLDHECPVIEGPSAAQGYIKDTIVRYFYRFKTGEGELKSWGHWPVDPKTGKIVRGDETLEIDLMDDSDSD